MLGSEEEDRPLDPTAERSARRVEVAAITTERGYASIMRIDGKRAATVTADVDEAIQSIYDASIT